MAIQDLYNVYFNLYSYESTGRNTLGQVEKIAVYKTSQKAYYTYLRGGEQFKFGKNNVIAKYRLFTNNLSIKSTDLVNINNLWFRIVSIDPCSNFAHHLELGLKILGSYNIPVSSGWTFGYDNPFPEAPISWRNWTYENTLNEARNTGDWGLLQLKNTENFVSDVQNTGDNTLKTVALSYDDYGTGSGNSGKHIWYRISDVTFSQDNTIMPWILYNNAFNTTSRFIQIKVGIYQ